MLPMTLSLSAFLYLLNYKLKLARFRMILTLRQLAPRSDATSQYFYQLLEYVFNYAYFSSKISISDLLNK